MPQAPNSESRTPPPPGTPSSPIVEREHGLSRELSSRQLAMIGLGGAIGTGLFLGSALAVRQAGPSVIISYLIGALVALLLMGALSEMAAAHPTPGSFGVYAELYVSRWAGFVVRYTYWAVQSIAIGGEATAAAIYCRWWFPATPAWLWIAVFSALLIYVNARAVGSFGEFEYWFSIIKVIAIVLFILFGALVLAGLAGPAPAPALRNYTAHGGFFPFGLKGAWLATVFAIYSYIGTEVVAVAAGEARDPNRAVPRAMRSMVGRLIVFYLGAIAVLVGIVPWNEIQPGADITASPFVKVFDFVSIPAAAHVVNFVVLTAALSSINCNLYLTARMMFSLARGGYAPASFGRVTARGTPLRALLVSAVGMVIATIVADLYPDTAYVILFGVALFGGLFVWLMIFVTHLFFRPGWIARHRGEAQSLAVRTPGYPYTSILGALLVVAILASTWWAEGMRNALEAGLPWLAFISLAYVIWARRNRPTPRA